MSATLTAEHLEHIREQARRAVAEVPPLTAEQKATIAAALAPRKGGDAT